jgi:hypothetical protein
MSTKAAETLGTIVGYGMIIGAVAFGFSACGKKDEAKAVVAPTAVVSTAPVVKSNWSTETWIDQMSGKTHSYESTTSTNTEQLRFPYNGGSKLEIVKYNDMDQIGISINRGQMMCHSFTACYIQVKFDDREPEYYSAYGPDNGNTTIAFIRGEDSTKFKQKLASAKKVLVQPPLFQANAVFQFDVSK